MAMGNLYIVLDGFPLPHHYSNHPYQFRHHHWHLGLVLVKNKLDCSWTGAIRRPAGPLGGVTVAPVHHAAVAFAENW